jgi:ketosteroid isomerase-like protein
MPALGWAGTRPMPAENLDIVRRGYDAWNRGDGTGTRA